MPVSSQFPTSAQEPTDLARRVVGLLNFYRLLLPPALLAIQYLTAPSPTVGNIHPTLFLSACILYFGAGIVLVLAQRGAWQSLRLLALTHAMVDSIAIAALLYASGGVASGLGILLVLPVGATALLTDSRNAFLIAATASLMLLVQQITSHVGGNATAVDYPTAGVIGAILFLMALGAAPIARRLRESEALVRRQEIDLANLAQLSQYIVQHLRESILVVDPEDRIRLINEPAAQMLGDQSAFPGALLGEASPRLLYLLATWRKTADTRVETAGTFVAADGARVIEPHFVPLGGDDPVPLLVFLEDTSVLASRVQQSKLAALGRLSASIAHEIRNPVGAMSHAGQLLGESDNLRPEDKRLTEIIRDNAKRVSEIIDNVLRMSRREASRPERLALDPWLASFKVEFCATMQCPPEQLRLQALENQIEVRVDPSQLRQVLWNLCENALKYGLPSTSGAKNASARGHVDLRYGRLRPNARPFLEVADRGHGIAPENAERIFEPFFTGGQRSSGLGLFLARELAQTNGATLLYEPRPEGGSIFRLVFADPQRWES